MDTKEWVCLQAEFDDLHSLEELESRLEAAACTFIDACLSQYCWQFASSYGCPTECVVRCGPFNGCWQYCWE